MLNRTIAKFLFYLGLAQCPTSLTKRAPVAAGARARWGERKPPTP